MIYRSVNCQMQKEKEARRQVSKLLSRAEKIKEAKARKGGGGGRGRGKARR